MKLIFAAILAVFSLNPAYAAPRLVLIETTPKQAELFKTLPDVSDVGIFRVERVHGMTEVALLLVDYSWVQVVSGMSHDVNGKCGGFFDVTDEDEAVLSLASKRSDQGEPFPALKGRDPIVEKTLAKVASANLESFVKLYSSQFSTRLANSDEGVLAPEWLANEWRKLAATAGRTDITVDLVYPPRGYDQKNVRLTIPGSDANAPMVVLGGHLDSINHKDGELAPGVDDNASGISALTETIRVLLDSDFHPRRTVQIFGYAAEEIGLLGSRTVAHEYSKQDISVYAALQLDMVAWPGTSGAVTFIDDYVDKDLNRWTEDLYNLYIGGPVKHDICEYACSDHASWTRYGYRSVFPFEAPDGEMNPRIHSAEDRWDQIMSAEHSAKFAKLAVAFATTLSQQ